MVDEELGAAAKRRHRDLVAPGQLVEERPHHRLLPVAPGRRAGGRVRPARAPWLRSDRVKAYRAGYLPEERRELERALADGELLGVAATNALELGIDVGSLDAALLAGYPGTRASMWQQAGRAGRRREASLAMLVAQDDPLDQYLVHHPDDLFERPPEAAVSTRRTRYVLEPHLACAAREHPLAPRRSCDVRRRRPPAARGAPGRRGPPGAAPGRAPPPGRESPHRAVDIRSASGHLFAIVDEETGALMGTVDEARATATRPPGGDLPPPGRAVRGRDARPRRHGGAGRARATPSTTRRRAT